MKPRYQALEDARKHAADLVSKVAKELADQPMWTLEQGVELAREIEAALIPAGWHAALAGSVLHRGTSAHDLDIIVYPRKKLSEPRPNIDLLRDALQGLGMRRRASSAAVRDEWRKRGSRDTKFVEVWATKDVRRVDLFVLS